MYAGSARAEKRGGALQSATTVQAAFGREGATANREGRARGAAHPEHVDHVGDAGRVEAERLVERIRALPSVSHGRAKRGGRGIRCGEGQTGQGGEYGAKRGGRGLRGARRREARGGRSAVHTRSVRRERERGGAAHVKHIAHVRDAGRVEVQRLWLNH